LIVVCERSAIDGEGLGCCWDGGLCCDELLQIVDGEVRSYFEAEKLVGLWDRNVDARPDVVS